MKISFKKINQALDKFFKNALRIKSFRLRKAITIVAYLAATVLLFGVLPFIIGIYLILLIFDKVKIRPLKYGLSTIIALIVLAVGIPWAGATYSSNYRNQNPAPQKIEQTATLAPSPTPNVEVKTESKEESISFETKQEETDSLSKGKTQVKQEGKDGKKVTTFEVTYTDGKETGRKQIKEEVAEQAQTKIVLIGTYVAPATTYNNQSDNNSSGSSGRSCGEGYYKNSTGNCVQNPGDNPSGATAKCHDGTYSYSQSRSGTCSHHGGVAEWL